MKILIVDDNVTDLNGIYDFVPWKRLGCQVVGTARNGQEGLDAALRATPNLIIADISMPLMDGVTMCQEIRKTLPDVNIIFLSCLEDFDYARQAANMGKCHYITKPIDIDNVIETILNIKKVHDSEIKKQLLI